jgi:hypothetical protein
MPSANQWAPGSGRPSNKKAASIPLSMVVLQELLCLLRSSLDRLSGCIITASSAELIGEPLKRKINGEIRGQLLKDGTTPAIR